MTPKKCAWYDNLGPGLVTGVSDDDPSGIATYSQSGARFGYGLLWTLLISYPLMVAVQMISARIGRVTGAGIAGNIRRYYGAWVLYPMVLLVLAANVINIAVDILAMGDSLRLLIGGPVVLYCLGFGILSALFQVFVRYTTYVKFLKWLTLVLLAYVVTVFSVRVDWLRAVRMLFVPSFDRRPEFFQAVVAILGTTISPYLFFWQSSGEVEEQECKPDEKPLRRAPRQGPAQLARIRADTLIGMGASNLIAFFIMLASAATLNLHGKTNIETAAQAAAALEPFAGHLSSLLFSLGIIGTGLLAVPVLAGSAAYAVAETFRWKASLEADLAQARKFYAVIVIATLTGVTLDLVKINPIQALVWSAILNGVIAVPIIAVVMLISSRKDVMGPFAVRGLLQALGWATMAVMLAAAVGMIATA